MGNGLQAVGHSNVMIIILVAVFIIMRNSNLGEIVVVSNCFRILRFDFFKLLLFCFLLLFTHNSITK